jgi:phosphatidylserine/phosphatidylglycerophosphate/cardiolipin synthase-like enzyme
MLIIIKPLEISTHIISLIDDADEDLIIVSPYVDIGDWNKMKKILKEAVSKNINIKFYVRKNTDCDLKPLYNMGIEPIIIPNLHTKLYISEKKAIITSQNMTKSSDDYSIDFGHETENLEEIQQLKDYVTKYLSIKIKKKKINITEVHGFKYNQYIKPLESSQLKKTKKKLESIFPDIKYYDNKNYIFSDSLISKIDFNLSENLSFKIYSKDIQSEISKIKEMEYSLLEFDYKSEIKLTNDYFYLIYEPTNTSYNDRVLEDYITIIQKLISIRS